MLRELWLDPALLTNGFLGAGDLFGCCWVSDPVTSNRNARLLSRLLLQLLLQVLQTFKIFGSWGKLAG